MGEWITWLEDLTQHDRASVGRKCANLGELTRAGFRVPPGFALSLRAYEQFLETTGAGEAIRDHFSGFDADPDDPKQLSRFTQSAAFVNEMLCSRPMPADIAEQVVQHYEELCRRTGIGDVLVATRSAGPASHPGQYESYLNVSGAEEVIRNVIRVWSSTFNTRSLIARARKGHPLESDPIGVAVLQMVEADAAGVMFTAEPTTADPTRMIIEGSSGLGEIVVGGSVIPDNWTVDATHFTIVDRRLSPASAAAADGAIPVTVGAAADQDSADGRQVTACLSDAEVIKIAMLGKTIEAHFGRPQDIEWAIDRSLASDPIFILQARPETFRINFRF
ncbi:MAG: PEP/pyruvate-binding domain-containing protein [Actinobacteria bacterium]|nr:PEP/pyruvate-binding domain-containing protein [Actinomycetota bacterium]